MTFRLFLYGINVVQAYLKGIKICLNALKVFFFNFCGGGKFKIVFLERFMLFLKGCNMI